MQFGVIYAGAQKNFGPAGITLVIVREDLLNHALPITPAILNFKENYAANSEYNTPPTFVYAHLKCIFFYLLKKMLYIFVIENVLIWFCVSFSYSIASIYVVGKVLNWIKKSGGIEAMYKNSLKKSQLLYERIDKSDGFYSCPVEKPYRSRMNVVFRIGGKDGDEALEAEFLKEAQALKMSQLKGHRSVGGIRASIYNAVTLDDTEALVKHMDAFLAKHKK